MSDPLTQRLTNIKLAELRRQRDHLDRHYAAVEQRAAEAASPLDRLRALYDGLRGAKFAQKPFHPDVANLDALFLESTAGTPSAELVEDWVQRLQRELARGRLRAEFAYAFGRLLDEWAHPTATAPAETPDQETWQLILRETPPALDTTLLLNALFQDSRDTFQSVRAGVKVFAEGPAFAPATDAEVGALLGLLAADPYRQPSLRRQAAEIRSRPAQINEYAGALTILLNNLAEWEWPADGLEPRTLWARTKWRAYLDEELVTLLFLQLIGLRWGMKFRSLLGPAMTEIDGLFRVRDDASWQSALARRRLTAARGLFLPAIPERSSDLQQLAAEGPYGGGNELDNPSALEKLLILLNAEVRLHQATSPNRPLYVIQTDLRDFYPSLPHPLLLSLLTWFNVPVAWLDFFRKYFAVRLKTPDGVRVARRGLVLDHLLGHVLADLVLLMMDAHVYRAAGVRPLRVCDDVFLLADAPEKARQAWRAVRQFCQACGLEINEPKSGSACLGGESLPELPPAPPRWGLLRLQTDGTWAVDEPAFDALQRHMDRQAISSASVLDMVSHYNDSVGYVQRNLGLCVRLDDGHLDRVGKRLARLHQELFGPGHGVVNEVRKRLGQTRGLPEALVYWPMTAGGLGLTHPLIPLAAFQKWREKMPDPPLPATATPGGNRDPGWVTYYLQWQQPLKLQPPGPTPALASLVKDFVARGGEVVGKKRRSPGDGLSTYWQWVVHTYGPSLLEALGTFRFLLTELVPLQLILQHRVEATSLGGDT